MLPSMGNRLSQDIGTGGGGVGSVFAPNPRLQRGGPVPVRLPSMGGGGGVAPIQAPVPVNNPVQQPQAPQQRSMFAPVMGGPRNRM